METLTAAAPAAETVAAYQQLPLEKIQPSPYQARKDFDPAELQGLADSMREEGLIQPIVVRKVNGSFELVSGERRFRAAKLLQWTTIDAKIVETVSEGEAAAKGLVENLQRKDLNPIEEAEGFDRLNKLDSAYWTQDKIAQVAGRSRGYITQSLSFLKFPPQVQDSVRRLTLSRSHALELLSLPPDKQQTTADQVVKEGLSIKQTRQLVAKMTGKGAAHQSSGHPVIESPVPYTFKEAGPDILITARISRTADLDGELAKLKGYLMVWIASHPYQAPTEEQVASTVEGTSPQRAPGDTTEPGLQPVSAGANGATEAQINAKAHAAAAKNAAAFTVAQTQIEKDNEVFK